MSTHTRKYITIGYKIRIFLEKEWQTLAIEATALNVTPGIAVVIQVLSIDGRFPSSDIDLEVVVNQAGTEKLLSDPTVNVIYTPPPHHTMDANKSISSSRKDIEILEKKASLLMAAAHAWNLAALAAESFNKERYGFCKDQQAKLLQTRAEIIERLAHLDSFRFLNTSPQYLLNKSLQYPISQ